MQAVHRLKFMGILIWDATKLRQKSSPDREMYNHHLSRSNVKDNGLMRDEDDRLRGGTTLSAVIGSIGPLIRLAEARVWPQRMVPVQMHYIAVHMDPDVSPVGQLSDIYKEAWINLLPKGHVAYEIPTSHRGCTSQEVDVHTNPGFTAVNCSASMLNMCSGVEACCFVL
jgi:hypothetical protein